MIEIYTDAAWSNDEERMTLAYVVAKIKNKEVHKIIAYGVENIYDYNDKYYYVPELKAMYLAMSIARYSLYSREKIVIKSDSKICVNMYNKYNVDLNSKAIWLQSHTGPSTLNWFVDRLTKVGFKYFNFKKISRRLLDVQ